MDDIRSFWERKRPWYAFETEYSRIDLLEAKIHTLARLVNKGMLSLEERVRKLEPVRPKVKGKLVRKQEEK